MSDFTRFDSHDLAEMIANGLDIYDSILIEDNFFEYLSKGLQKEFCKMLVTKYGFDPEGDDTLGKHIPKEKYEEFENRVKEDVNKTYSEFLEYETGGTSKWAAVTAYHTLIVYAAYCVAAMRVYTVLPYEAAVSAAKILKKYLVEVCEKADDCSFFCKRTKDEILEFLSEHLD